MRWDIRRVVLVALGTFGVLSASLCLLGLYGRATGLPGLVFDYLAGWTVPLSSVMVICGVGWLLLSQAPGKPSGHASEPIQCSSCGRSVMRDWRMCPYCGSALEPAAAPAPHATGA